MKLFAVIIFTTGLVALIFGLIGIIRPVTRLHMPTRKRAAGWVSGGVVVMIIGLLVGPSPQAPKKEVARADPPRAAIYTSDYQTCIARSGTNVAFGSNYPANEACRRVAELQGGKCGIALIELAVANEDGSLDRGHIDDTRQACEPTRISGDPYARPALQQWPVDEDSSGHLAGESGRDKRLREAFLRAHRSDIAACYNAGDDAACIGVLVAIDRESSGVIAATSACSTTVELLQSRLARTNQPKSLPIALADVGGELAPTTDTLPVQTLPGIANMATDCDHELTEAGLAGLAGGR